MVSKANSKHSNSAPCTLYPSRVHNAGSLENAPLMEKIIYTWEKLSFSNSAYQKGYRIYIYTYIHDHYLATSILIFHAKSPRSFPRWFAVPIFGHPISTCQSCFISSAASWAVKNPRFYIYIVCIYGYIYICVYVIFVNPGLSCPWCDSCGSPVGPDQRWDADLVLSDRVVVTDRVRSKHSCFGDFATKLQYHISYIYVYYIYVCI